MVEPASVMARKKKVDVWFYIQRRGGLQHLIMSDGSDLPDTNIVPVLRALWTYY